MAPDEHAERLMARQYGLITLAQALDSGLSPDQVQHRVRTGRWQRVMRGIYRTAAAPASWRQRTLAAVLGGPVGTVASHLTVAALHGLWLPPARPRVTVPTGASARLPIARVYRRRLTRRDIMSVDGIRSTTPARMLVDCATVLTPLELSSVVDGAFCAKLVATRPVLEAAERAPGRRGFDALFRLIDMWTPGIEPGSPAEMRLVRRLEEWGFPPPVLQYEVRDSDGQIIAVPDLAWPGTLVGLEYDSDRWHSPPRWAHDEARIHRLGRLGWVIRRVGKADLMPSETWLRDDLRRLLARRAA